ncbi:MAG: ABC transporter ATP-binding protein [Victivallales bacterium]
MTPDKVREILQRDHPGEEIIISLSSDIAGHRHYGAEWLVVTNKTVLVYCIGDTGVAGPCHDIPLASLKKARISPHVGIMSFLVEPKTGSPFKIISFSQVLNPLFAHAAEDISRLANNEPISDKSTLTGKICSSCRKPIPEELNKCPRCTDRRGTLLRISQFAMAYKGTLILILMVMIAGTVFGLLTPYMSKLFIDVILKPDPVTGEFVNKSWLGPASLVLLGAYAMQLFLGGIQERLSGILGFKTVADVRQRIYEKLQELSLGFFDKHQTGALLARVNQDTQEMQRLLVDFVPITIESILMFIGIGIFLFVLSWQLTLFVLIPILCIVIFVKMIIPKLWIYFHRFFHRRSKLSAIVADSLSGIRVVKAFGQEQMETDKFQKYSMKYRDAGIDLAKRWSVFHPIFHLFIMSGMVIVWYVGGYLIYDGKMTLGSVVAYSGYLMMFYRPVFMLTRMLDLITNALSAAERVFDVIDTEPMIKESPDAVGLSDLKGEIEFRNVTFGYDKFKPVLKNVSLTIRKHEMIGLVGKSGAGKSTMINVICRLYDTTGGQILLDGVDLRNIKQNDLRRNIGIVLQDTFLFNGTIYENISYTKPGATREEVIRASIAANAHEFILKKPDGYDTEVGERGNSLSGGEKQRISIARAILRDPKILILDEATSSVDTQTEKKIQEALEHLTKGRTTIAIAHRLSTLRKCDRLVVLKNGEIGEIGTHQELMAKKGSFYELVQIQSELAQIMAFETPAVEENGKKSKHDGDKSSQDNADNNLKVEY